MTSRCRRFAAAALAVALTAPGVLLADAAASAMVAADGCRFRANPTSHSGERYH